ncbi:MAG: CoA pyrophosphatase [Tissierellia bacterium]|nr:CoA pyrophosphatase [Tissierellia bacterium]
MNIDKILNNISGRIPKPIDHEKKYSILVALIENNGQWEIIYELRAKTLNKQPGEVSFPGGEVETGETFKHAALRETMEELLIEEDNISIIGELDYLVANENMIIHCFLGVIKGVNLNEIKPNKDEVDHLFTVPLEFLLNNEPDRYELDIQTLENEEFPYNLIPNGKKYKFRRGKHQVLFYKYKNYIIWGFTAKMTKNFVDIYKSVGE